MKKAFITTHNPNALKRVEKAKRGESLTSKEMFSKLNKKNQTLITKFLDFKTSCNLSSSRLRNINNHLIKFAYCIEKDMDKAEEEEIAKVGGLIHKAGLKNSSLNDQIVDVRQFYKWLKGKNKHYPPEVDSFIVRTKFNRDDGLKAEDLLSEEEVIQMIKACNNDRDKFFLALVGLDGGLRPTEARNLKWGDLKEDQYGHYIIIHTAKGSGDTPTRPIRIIKSKPYLVKWMSNYPKERNDKYFVFCDLNNANPENNISMTENTLSSLFKRLKIKLGWKKRIYPYLMRHTILTKMAKNPGVSTAVLKAFAGHRGNSNVIARYTHLANSDIMDAQLQINGIKKDEEIKEESHLPIKCPNCGTSNEFDAEICGKCNMALTQKRMVEVFEKNKEIEAKFALIDKIAKVLKLDKNDEFEVVDGVLQTKKPEKGTGVHYSYEDKKAIEEFAMKRVKKV